MRLLTALCVFALCLSACEKSAPKVSAREHAEALSALATQDQIDAVFEQMSSLMTMAMQNAIRDSGAELSPEGSVLLADVMVEEIFSALKPELQSMQADIYLRHFTQDELADIRTFMESETGRTFNEKSGVFLSEAAEEGQKITRRAMPDILERVAVRLSGPEGSELTEEERDAMRSLLE